MIYPLQSLPQVDAMQVRRFTFTFGWSPAKGGLSTWREVGVELVELAASRLPYDEPVVDCSYAIFALTNELIQINASVQPSHPGDYWFAYFNGRRWRELREGNELTPPAPHGSLLYIGNPILIKMEPDGLQVFSPPEFLVKSGVALQAQMENA